MIYDIQRNCIHDGDGIRTVVFFKGCDLKCGWCANPESQSFAKERGFFANKCTQCGACLLACPTGAVSGQNACVFCGKCEYVCLSEAVKLYGREYAVEEVVDLVLKDEPFYRTSGGGVTLSGGEPTMQPDYLRALLRALKQKNVHTCIESHGGFSDEIRQMLLLYVDQFLIDLKHMDSETCKRFTGRGNEQTLNNILAIAEAGKDITIRIPVIPGFNDTEQNMRESAGFAKRVGLDVHLLAFHKMASGKYEALVGRDYAYANCDTIPEETMERFVQIFAEHGVKATIGG